MKMGRGLALKKGQDHRQPLSSSLSSRGPCCRPRLSRAAQIKWNKETMSSQQEQGDEEQNSTTLARTKLLEALSALGISYEQAHHPPVMTVDAQMEQVGSLVDQGAVIAKNLFLKDKRGKYMMITARHDTEIDLKCESGYEVHVCMYIV